jgi:hypothetical protein
MERESATDRMFQDRESAEPPKPNPIVPPPPRTESQSKRPSSSRPRSRPTGGSSKPKKAPERKDYRTPILGIGQLAAAPCLLAGQALRRPELIADAAAITINTPPIADAINELAHEDAQVAAILDKLLVVGPYGALLAATMPLIAQIVTNHRASVLPITQAFGAVDPERLVATLVDNIEVNPNGNSSSEPTGGNPHISA